MNCWFWNIAAGHEAYFRAELEKGRLRQGWGYDRSLDLRLLKSKKDEGLDLTRSEQAAWDRCRPMLSRIKIGDLVAVKNVPSRQFFSLVRVNGAYGFDIGPSGDFGHFLPVEPIEVFHRLAGAVPAPLANALAREQHPIRVTYKHKERLLALAEVELSESAATQPETLREILEQLRQDLVDSLKEELREKLNHRLAERLVFNMLQWDGLNAVYNAGAGEQGADVLTEVELGYALTASLAVQVKHHTNVDNDTTGITQLRRAFEAHDVDAGLLVTFAHELGDDLKQATADAQKELNIDVVYGDELYDRLLRMITDPEFEPTMAD